MTDAALTASMVAKGLEQLIDYVERERLQLYRLQLQAVIRTVPELLPEMLRRSDVSWTELADRLPVPARWRGDCLGSARIPARLWVATSLIRGSARKSLLHRCVLERDISRSGAVARPSGLDGLGLGVVVRAGAIEAVTEIGTAILHVRETDATLFLPEPLPETVRAALPGRALSALISCPLLDSRRYLVRDVLDGPPGVGCIVRFRAGTIPVTMPWHAECSLALETAFGCIDVEIADPGETY